MSDEAITIAHLSSRHINDPRYAQLDYIWTYYPRDVRGRMLNDERFCRDIENGRLDKRKTNQMIENTIGNKMFNVGVFATLFLGFNIRGPRFTLGKIAMPVT